MVYPSEGGGRINRNTTTKGGIKCLQSISFAFERTIFVYWRKRKPKGTKCENTDMQENAQYIIAFLTEERVYQL